MNSGQMQELTPEQIELWMQLNGMGEESAGLDEQMLQAQALQKGNGVKYSTGLGAALGGVGDVIKAAYGSYKEDKARQEKGDLRKKMTDIRTDYAKRLAGVGQAVPGAPIPGTGQDPLTGGEILSSPMPMGYGRSASQPPPRQPPPGQQSPMMNANPFGPYGYSPGGY